jgi:hypothetical protein
MAAKLSANKNPVYITTPPGTVVLEPVEISWDTDGNFPGDVYLAINGGGAIRLGGGNRTGKLTENVSLGNSYLFMLRRVGNTANLAILTVTVLDLEQVLIDSSLGSLALEHAINPPQSITGLRAEPSVDMVRVWFTTVRATIPTITVETLDGEPVGIVVPFLEGEKTKHAVKGTLHLCSTQRQFPMVPPTKQTGFVRTFLPRIPALTSGGLSIGP